MKNKLRHPKVHHPESNASNSEVMDYPINVVNDDTDSQWEEDMEINPEGIFRKKVAPKGNELGSGLDVPGSELDDQQESVGSEDEENNYYSIGGENHKELEEDQA